MKYIISVLALCSFLFAWDKAFGETVTTGNLLTNSTFGTGETTTTTGWSTGGDHGIHTHGEWGFPYQTGMDDSGGVLAFEGHEEDNVYQDVDLVGDGHLTQYQINQGFTSTMAADVWFWNSIENTFTLKQTITDSDGSVSTQVREINDHDPSRSTNGGQFTNYTNIYTHGSNTQTDFTIRAEVYNETAGTSYDNSHRGPDVDNITLNVTYSNIPPINEGTQDVIDDIDTDIVDIIEDIPEDFDWYTEDIVLDDTYTWGEDEYMWEDDYTWEDDFYFEEELETIDFDMVDFEELPMFEEFETFEEMPIIEEVFFEEDYMMEPPPMIMEEIFTEEFEEDFTEFLEETGMEEEFMEFLEDEGITAEEFFEEITEEEFDDEPTTESFEEFEEEFEEIETVEESTPEVIETEEETVELESESEIVEEEEVTKNESTEEAEPQEDESSSESTEESEVQSEDSEKQDGVQQEGREEVDTNDRVTADVAKIESKFKKNLKKIAKQIAKVTKQTTQNLTKEDLFFKNNTLDAYNKIQFYKSKDIYKDTSLDLFNNQIDLGVYDKEIYGDITLASYSQNDPVEVHRVQLLEAKQKTNRLKLELEAMKNENN